MSDAIASRRPASAAVLVAAIATLVVAWVGGSTSTATGQRTSETGRPDPVTSHAPSLAIGLPICLPEVATAPALQLDGKVVDYEDQPVGGAHVTLGGGRVVVSEADGSFAFDGLAAGTYDVSAESGERYGEVQRVQLDDTFEPVTLTVVHGPALVVHVVDDRGQPIPGATVELSPRTFVTGADGSVRIRALARGDDLLQVSAEGRKRVGTGLGLIDEQAVMLEATVELDLAAEVAGRVIAADGAPVPGASVELGLVGGGTGGDAITDDTGAWSMPAVIPGAYLVHAKSGLDVAAGEISIEHDGVRPTVGVVVRLERGGEIAGRVVDAAGQPIAGVEVSNNTTRDTTDTGGRFALRGLRPDTYRVWARTETLGATLQEVVLARGQHAELGFVVVPSSLAGVVVDSRGEPVDDAQVFADGPDGAWVCDTDAHGHFELGGISPGHYEITARRPRSQSASPPVEVTTSNEQVRLVVPDPTPVSKE